MRSASEILAIKCDGLTGATAAMQEMALEETGQFIRNYCNRDCIPSEMNFIWANMALDLLNGAYITPNLIDSSEAIRPCEVSSFSAGDMSVSRGSDTMAHKVNLDNLLLNYRDQLNRFRLMYWGEQSPGGRWF